MFGVTLWLCAVDIRLGSSLFNLFNHSWHQCTHTYEFIRIGEEEEKMTWVRQPSFAPCILYNCLYSGFAGWLAALVFHMSFLNFSSSKPIGAIRCPFFVASQFGYKGVCKSRWHGGKINNKNKFPIWKKTSWHEWKCKFVGYATHTNINLTLL